MINLQSFYWLAQYSSFFNFVLRWSEADFFSRWFLFHIGSKFVFPFEYSSCDRLCTKFTVLHKRSLSHFCRPHWIMWCVKCGFYDSFSVHELISFGFNFLFIYLCIRFCSNDSKTHYNQQLLLLLLFDSAVHISVVLVVVQFFRIGVKTSAEFVCCETHWE